MELNDKFMNCYEGACGLMKQIVFRKQLLMELDFCQNMRYFDVFIYMQEILIICLVLIFYD